MRTPPKCPTCGMTGKPVLVGRLSERAMEALLADDVASFGCIPVGEGETWLCPLWHDWPADEQDWRAAVRSALRGRPACNVCGGPSVELVAPGEPDLDGWADEIAEGNAVIDDRPQSAERYRCTECGRRWR